MTNLFGNKLPSTLGFDISGTVSEVCYFVVLSSFYVYCNSPLSKIGEGVLDVSVGDEVFGRAGITGGGFAEVCISLLPFFYFSFIHSFTIILFF
jgi:hypothetical protein